MTSLSKISEERLSTDSAVDVSETELLRRSEALLSPKPVAKPTAATASLAERTPERPTPKFHSASKADLAARSEVLASRLRSHTATPEEKAEFKEVVTELKSIKKEEEETTSRRRLELSGMKAELTKLDTEKEAAAVARRKRELDEILGIIEQAESVDLCFILDCTGSMTSYMAGVKEHIRSIVRLVRRSHPLLKLRIAFVGYRDPLEPGGGPNVAFDFVDVTNDGQNLAWLSSSARAHLDPSANLTKFEAFIGSQKPFGGGDGCEDVAGGFCKVLELSWQNTTRVLFHIGDAPCHGRDFHEGKCSDNHSGSDHNILALLARLKSEARVEYHFAKLNDSTDKMVRCFNAAMAPDGLGTAFVRMTTMSDPKEIVTLVSGSITKSVTHSAVRLSSAKKIDPSKVIGTLTARAGA